MIHKVPRKNYCEIKKKKKLVIFLPGNLRTSECLPDRLGGDGLLKKERKKNTDEESSLSDC